MFRKLLKYEWRAMMRTMLPIYGATLAVALINGFLFQNVFGTGSETPALLEYTRIATMTLYIFVMAAMGVFTAVMVIQRFYKGLLRQEGYLMFTLPVKTWQLVFSKACVSLAATFCSLAVGILSLGMFGGIDFYPLKNLSTITAVTSRFYKDWDQNRYTEYLRQFSLDESKQFRTLSNGMKVKYLLALALSHHAKLYLLDEPTSGLDPVSRDEILHLFTRIVKDGKRSILFSTHITSDLDRCADDITYIQNGKVLQSADKDTFLRSFDHLKTPEDSKPLTLEEIMLRTEGRNSDETAL